MEKMVNNAGVYYHSVTLDEEKCKGCTNCIKRCPAEAIRVRNGKARIIDRLCIDCGECIRACPNHAKVAVTDSWDLMEKFKYRIALPAPSLYGQFKNVDVDSILTALLEIGFDDVFEVALGADIISRLTRQALMENRLRRPVISSSCPAVVRLIQIRFPSLLDNVLDLCTPMEAAATLAKDEAVRKTGLRREEIGAFFISPCGAKVTSVRKPIGTDKTDVDGVFSLASVYSAIVDKVKKVHPLPLSKASMVGVGWAKSGGEASGTLLENTIYVDGIQNVIKVLEEVELGKWRTWISSKPWHVWAGVWVVLSPWKTILWLSKELRNSQKNGRKTKTVAAKSQPKTNIRRNTIWGWSEYVGRNLWREVTPWS